MKAHHLTGSKSEIAQAIAHFDGEVREAIVFVEEPTAVSSAPADTEDIFAEMEPFMVHVGDADYSREAIYTRMEGE